MRSKAMPTGICASSRAAKKQPLAKPSSFRRQRQVANQLGPDHRMWRSGRTATGSPSPPASPTGWSLSLRAATGRESVRTPETPSFTMVRPELSNVSAIHHSRLITIVLLSPQRVPPLTTLMHDNSARPCRTRTLAEADITSPQFRRLPKRDSAPALQASSRFMTTPAEQNDLALARAASGGERRRSGTRPARKCLRRSTLARRPMLRRLRSSHFSVSLRPAPCR